MITITITSDESLTDPHFDVLHRACREVAENTGQLVHVKAEFTIAPVPIPTVRADFPPYKMHQWPTFSDPAPPSHNIDEEESAQYVVGWAGVKESLTDDGWIEWYGGECPVPAGTTIEVKYRDGVVCTTQALNSQVTTERTAESWRHSNHRGDIVAYRIPCTITTSSLLKDQVDVKN